MNDLSWAEIVRRVHQRANNRCEYCQTSQRIIGQAMHVEHIDPSGGDDLDNLCLSCPNCNLSKAKAINAPDPHTGQSTPLFNPRNDQWIEHFEWQGNGTFIAGKTAVGRATVIRLKVNQPRIVEARTIWVLTGLHPPETG